MQPECPEKAHVVIIGGGLIGSSIAYQLTQKNIRDVVVLEQGDIGAQGATSACLGGLRTQFATAVNIRFSLISREIFKGFKKEFGTALDFKPYGYLFLAANPAQWNVFQNTAKLMGEMKIPVELLSRQDVARQWPFLNVQGLAGGSYTSDDGFYSPIDALRAFVKKAKQNGVRFLEQVRVSGLEISNKKVGAVVTSDGQKIKADVVVNAAGPWAGRVAALAGLELPVSPLRRHLFFSDAVPELPNIFPMIIDINSGWYMKREGQGLILGGPAGEKTFSHHIDFDAEEWTAIESIRHVPALENAKIIRGWIGHYELTPDRHAAIGAFPELENFICAAGFSGHGFQHSPAVGIVVAEQIADGRVHTEDIHLLRPTRFRENDLIHEPITAFQIKTT